MKKFDWQPLLITEPDADAVAELLQKFRDRAAYTVPEHRDVPWRVGRAVLANGLQLSVQEMLYLLELTPAKADRLIWRLLEATDMEAAVGIIQARFRMAPRRMSLEAEGVLKQALKVFYRECQDQRYIAAHQALQAATSHQEAAFTLWRFLE